MANHSNILAWNISRTEISGGDLTRGDCNDHLGVEDTVWLEGEQVLLAALWVRDARPSKACQSVYYSLAFSQSSCGTDSHSTVACSLRAVEELITFSSIRPLGWRRWWHPTPVLLPGKIPWAEEPGGLQSMGSHRVGHDWVTSLSLFTFMRWRRKWQPTPVFLPGESQGRGSLVSCRLWGRTESDTTEVT